MADPEPTPTPTPAPVQVVTSWRHWIGMAAMMFCVALTASWIVRHFDRPQPAPPVRPFASIAGPDVVEKGRMVAFTNTGSNADQFVWDVPDGDWKKDSNGGTVYGTFTAGGKYNVGMAALAIVDKKIATATANHAVLVTDPNPPPTPVPPGPTPPPPVPPAPVPPGRFGLSQQVINFAAAVTQPDAEKKALASLLANNFDSIATQVAAGTIKSPSDIQIRTEQTNIATQGPSRAYWAPFWASLAQAIKVLDGTQIKTLNDFADAWREIAVGLRNLR